MSGEWTELGRFHDHNLVSLIRSRLESEGIRTMIPNEYSSALQIPIFSGPMRLMVRASQVEEARRILEANAGDEDDEGGMESAEESVGDAEEAEDDDAVWTKAVAVSCPHCRSTDAAEIPRSMMEALSDFVFQFAAFHHRPRTLRCSSCGTEWRED